MIFGKRKREKIRQNIIDNLTLKRLEGDLFAVEAAIRDNAPKTASNEGGYVRRFINEVITGINNTVRRINTRELSVNKDKAQKALTAFRASHSEKDFEISGDPEKFRNYIDKNLFKKDHDGIAKLSFALIFALDQKEHEYQCPEESLEVVSEILFDDYKRLGKLYARYKNNYEKIHNSMSSEFDTGLNLGSGLASALTLSVMPICITGLVTFMSYIRNKREVSIAFKNLSASETNASIAFYMTLIEEVGITNEEKRREMVDELLNKLDNIRADAQYRWYVEGDNIPDAKQTIEVCDLSLKRLGQILGV